MGKGEEGKRRAANMNLIQIGRSVFVANHIQAVTLVKSEPDLRPPGARVAVVLQGFPESIDMIFPSDEEATAAFGQALSELAREY
jgi:hypothetical protein